MEPQELRDLLEDRFAGAEVLIERLPGTNRLTGHIVWSGFEGMDHFERQEKIWELMRNNLGAQSAGISVILSYAPSEYNAMAGV